MPSCLLSWVTDCTSFSSDVSAVTDVKLQIPNDWSGLPGVVGTAVNGCPLKCCIAACLDVLVADLAVLDADLAALDAHVAVCLSGRKTKLPVQLSQSSNPHATLSAASWMMTGCLAVRKTKM